MLLAVDASRPAVPPELVEGSNSIALLRQIGTAMCGGAVLGALALAAAVYGVRASRTGEEPRPRHARLPGTVSYLGLGVLAALALPFFGALASYVYRGPHGG